MELVLTPVEKMPATRGRRGENQAAAEKILAAARDTDGPLLAARGSRHKMDSLRVLCHKAGAEAVVTPTDDSDVFELTVRADPF